MVEPKIRYAKAGVGVSCIYEWPDYYDWTSPGLDRDVTYYVELAKQCKGPVLELGCGTGRVTLAVAQAGVPIVGLDISEDMINRARKKSEEMGLDHLVSWKVTNMTQMDLLPPFHLVIIPYRAFLHLQTVREQISVLKQLRALLTDDGVLALNVFVPHLDQMLSADEKLTYRGTYPIPGKSEIVEAYDFTEYDHSNQFVHVLRYYERFDDKGYSLERLRTTFQFRYLYPTELSHLLALTGFKVLSRYGTFHRKPFDRQSQELIVEAVKRL